MRKYSKFFIALLLLTLFNLGSSAQTTLAPGDVAFTGYIANTSVSATDDRFSFVLLAPVTHGTELKFTDRGWLSTNAFRGFESFFKWTVSGSLPAGTEVTINGLTASTGQATITGGGTNGTVNIFYVGTTTSFNLANAGDQIFCYQGTEAAPTFICGIHYTIYTIANGSPANTIAASLEGNAFDGFSSALPPGLVAGTNLLIIGTIGSPNSGASDAKFNCAGPISTVAQIRTAVYNLANWVLNPIIPDAPANFTIPTGCNYLNILSPTIDVTGTPLAAFTSCAGSESTEQSFTVSGYILNANIVITAPADFEISKTSGSGFTSSISLTQSGGFVPGTTIYVRVIASATGTPSGNITVASSGITTVDVAVTGTVNNPSVAPTSISGTTTYCNPGSTTLTAVGGVLGTGANYQWGTGGVVGTSPISGETNSTLIVSAAITTTYWVRIENNAAPCPPNTDGVTQVVTVNLPSVDPTGATGTTTICNGGSTTLTVAGGSKGTGAGTEWFTESCGGTPAGTGDAITVSPTTTTTYYVRYKGACNTTACATVTVTVNTLSTAPTGATGTTTICNGGSTTLTVTGGSKGTGAGTEWFTGSCGGTPAGTGDAITVSPTTTTTYYVRYKGTCNTTTCATVTVTVNTLSTAPTGATGTTTICNGGSTTLTVTGGSKGTGAGTEWFTGSCGGTPAGTGDAITVSPTSTTTYYVRYSGTCNNTSCATVTVTVNTAPVVTTNPVSQSVVPPNTVTFTAAASGSPTPSVQWQVSTGGPFTDMVGETSTTLSFITTEGQNGNQYQAVFTNTCDIATTTAATLTTCTTPVVTTNPQSQVICAGNTVNFTAAATGIPTPTLKWQVSTGGPFADISGATSTTLSFTTTALQNNNQYRAVFTNACALGGVNTTTATLTVNTAPVISCPGNISVNNTPGLCGAIVTYPAATATGSPAPTITYSKASGTFFPVGTTTVTATATNTCGTATCSFTVTVVDNQPPLITCPANKTSSSDAGLCTKTFTAAQIGLPTASDNCSYNISWSRSDAAANLTDPFPFGVTTITWKATDPAGLTASCNQTITIDKVTTITTVTVSPNSQQYSDKVTFVATVTPANCSGAGAIGGTVTFKIGTLVMGSAPVLANGTATLANVALLEPTLNPSNPKNGPLKPGAKTVTAVYSGTDADYIVSNPTTSLTINCEDARAYYTGACYSSTTSPTSSSAIVTLSATIKDISATLDAAGDVSPGDIRNATVTFINRDNNTIIAANVPVGLVNPGDLTVGTATFNWSTTITGDAQLFTIGIIVNNYYCRNSADDNAVVTVAKPLGQLFITGGGYLVLNNSAGIKAGKAGTKNNFGFNVKYNKAKTNLQGNINTIVRRMETDGMHVYQIKGNSMTSLAVNENCPKTATFNGKANITDITNPVPVSIEGNATLQVKMTDMGEPGSSDKIAITVWNKSGGLWFTSNWNGTTTVEQILGGGNLKVHGGTVCSPILTRTTEPITVMPKNIEPEVIALNLMAYPNPSTSNYTILVNSSNKKDKIILQVMDVSGRIVEVRNNIIAGSAIKLGDKYRPGIYFIRVIQGKEHKEMKLVKVSE